MNSQIVQFLEELAPSKDAKALFNAKIEQISATFQLSFISFQKLQKAEAGEDRRAQHQGFQQLRPRRRSAMRHYLRWWELAPKPQQFAAESLQCLFAEVV